MTPGCTCMGLFRFYRELLLSASACAALVSLVALVGAPGLPDEDRAQAAARCQAEITRKGRSFLDKTMKGLAKCTDGLGKCIQTQKDTESRDKCTARVAGKCVKELDKIAGQRAKLTAAIEKRCDADALPFGDFKDMLGLGYEQLEVECASLGAGPSLDNILEVADCVADQHECAAQKMHVAAHPRAGELLAIFVSAHLLCVDDFGGTGADVNNPSIGKAVDRCTKQLAKSGRRFAIKKLKSLEKCVNAVFTCTQRKPLDAKCLPKAVTKCDRSFAAISSEMAKLDIGVERKCSADTVTFGTLLDEGGANLGALADECGFVGVPSLVSLADYELCLFRLLECRIDSALGYEMPRLAEMLDEVGRVMEVPAMYCAGLPTPTPTPDTTPVATGTAPPPVTATSTPTAPPVPTTTPTVTPSATGLTPTVTPTPVAPPPVVPDIVFANFDEADRVCASDGVGGYVCADMDAAALNGFDVALGFFDGDGRLDALVANDGEPNRSCLGNGLGGFTCTDVDAVAGRTFAVAVGYVDADGHLDGVFSNVSGERNRLCRGDGAGVYTCSDVSTDGNTSRDVALGDLNNDQNLDAVFANAGQKNRLCLGDGSGGFTCSDVSTDTGPSFAVGLGYVNADTNLDAIFGNFKSTQSRLLRKRWEWVLLRGREFGQQQYAGRGGWPDRRGRDRRPRVRQFERAQSRLPGQRYRRVRVQ